MAPHLIVDKQTQSSLQQLVYDVFYFLVYSVCINICCMYKSVYVCVCFNSIYSGTVAIFFKLLWHDIPAAYIHITSSLTGAIEKVCAASALPEKREDERIFEISTRKKAKRRAEEVERIIWKKRWSLCCRLSPLTSLSFLYNVINKEWIKDGNPQLEFPNKYQCTKNERKGWREMEDCRILSTRRWWCVRRSTGWIDKGGRGIH